MEMIIKIFLFMVAVKGSQDYRGRQSEFKTNDLDFPCDFLVFLKCYLLVQKV